MGSEIAPWDRKWHHGIRNRPMGSEIATWDRVKDTAVYNSKGFSF